MFYNSKGVKQVKSLWTWGYGGERGDGWKHTRGTYIFCFAFFYFLWCECLLAAIGILVWQRVDFSPGFSLSYARLRFRASFSAFRLLMCYGCVILFLFDSNIFVAAVVVVCICLDEWRRCTRRALWNLYFIVCAIFKIFAIYMRCVRTVYAMNAEDTTPRALMEMGICGTYVCDSVLYMTSMRRKQTT